MLLARTWRLGLFCLKDSCLFFKRKTVAVLPLACCGSFGFCGTWATEDGWLILVARALDKN